MFAFVTAVTFVFLFFLAYSNAALIILSVPSCVATVKSMLTSSFTAKPLLPNV